MTGTTPHGDKTPRSAFSAPMIPSQETAAPARSASPESGASSCSEHPATPPSSSCGDQPTHLGGPDPTCIVHRLAEALQITEALQLTNDQKSKITDLFKKQTEQLHGLCAQARQLHQATHAQMLALLTSDQQKSLQALSPPEPEHCCTNTAAVPGGKATAATRMHHHTQITERAVLPLVKHGKS
jgi:Spy/CpxP family protein refolding chaperone